MRSFNLGPVRIDVMAHTRVMGEDFPRPDPGAIAEAFQLEVFHALTGEPIDLGEGHGNALTEVWVGREVVDVYDDAGLNKIGTKRGADFRTRFWPEVRHRVAKYMTAREMGVTIREVRDSDFTDGRRGLAIAALRQAGNPSDLKAHDVDGAIQSLTGRMPVLGHRIPRGTTVNIDCDFDCGVTGTGAATSDTGTTHSAGNDAGDAPDRSVIFRFPLSSIPNTVGVTDVDLQVNVTADDAETNDLIEIHCYHTVPGTDPSPDSAATRWTRSSNGTEYTTYDANGTGSRTFDLGTTADADVEGELADTDLCSIAFYPDGTMDASEESTIEAIENVGTDPATLVVTYATQVALTGSIPSQSGDIAAVELVAPVGDLPSQTGHLNIPGWPRVVGASAPASNNASTTLSFSHTVTPGVNLLVVVIADRNDPIISVKFGGVDLSLAVAQGGTHGSEIWYLEEPTIGTDDIDIVSTGSNSMAAGAINVADAVIPNPIRDTTATTGADITVDSDVNDLVIDCCMATGITSGGTPDSGQTEIFDHSENGGQVNLLSSWERATGATTTLDWTITEGNIEKRTAISLKTTGTQQVPLAGDLPSQSGVALPVELVSPAGNLPSQSGLLSLLAHIALSGALPSQSGIVVSKEFEALSGDLPAQSGILSLLAHIALAGNLPEQTGVINAGSGVFLVGDLPSQSGLLSLLAHIALLGDLPSQSGALSFVSSATVTGDLPAQTGVVTIKYLLALTGDLPSQSGAISLRAFIDLTGDLPAQSGDLASLLSISLTGDLPAQSGSLSLSAFISLLGDLPAQSGSLALVASINLTGDLPSQSGSLNIVVGEVFFHPDVGVVVFLTPPISGSVRATAPVAGSVSPSIPPTGFARS